MAAMSEQEIAGYKEVFDMFDLDGSGSISSGELKVALEEMGHMPTDEEVQALLKQIDADGSDKVEWGEFLAMFQAKPKKQHTEANLRKAFREIDKDKSGKICSNEVKQFLRKSGIGEDIIPDGEIDAIIAEVDTSGDGKISFEEFLRMMNA
ncbi:unnamed protein product [Owenia fusiformis]|uniref:Uncharacterized protein n=1 Tax=Owenia fusiformis TaxID=6347 RepID=A0A8J1UL45_OWEFU|nr:unnamed protein product [Owenia fusiformis]